MNNRRGNINTNAAIDVLPESAVRVLLKRACHPSPAAKKLVEATLPLAQLSTAVFDRKLKRKAPEIATCASCGHTHVLHENYNGACACAYHPGRLV